MNTREVWLSASTQMPRSDYERMEAAAERLNVSRAEILRRCVVIGLAKIDELPEGSFQRTPEESAKLMDDAMAQAEQSAFKALGMGMYATFGYQSALWARLNKMRTRPKRNPFRLLSECARDIAGGASDGE